MKTIQREIQERFGDFIEFFKIRTMDSVKLLDYLEKELRKEGYNVRRNEDYYLWADGEKGTCVVAHVDTVAEPASNIDVDEYGVVHVRKKIIDKIAEKTSKIIGRKNRSRVLGADDRAGVFMALQIARESKPCIIFTNYEEKGGIGADALTKDGEFIEFSDNIRMFIEIDRRGSNDAVFYSCGNEDMKSFVESFGFEEAMGSFSDISLLMPRTGVCGVNISAGYSNEHTERETLKLYTMKMNKQRIKDMIESAERMNLYFPYIEYYGMGYERWNEADWDEYERWCANEYGYLPECSLRDFGFIVEETGETEEMEDILHNEELLDEYLDFLERKYKYRYEPPKKRSRKGKSKKSEKHKRL